MCTRSPSGILPNTNSFILNESVYFELKNGQTLAVNFHINWDKLMINETSAISYKGNNFMAHKVEPKTLCSHDHDAVATLLPPKICCNRTQTDQFGRSKNRNSHLEVS